MDILHTTLLSLKRIRGRKHVSVEKNIKSLEYAVALASHLQISFSSEINKRNSRENITKEVQVVIDRVAAIEDSLTGEATVPHWYVDVLRELRQRVHRLEQLMEEEIEKMANRQRSLQDQHALQLDRLRQQWDRVIDDEVEKNSLEFESEKVKYQNEIAQLKSKLDGANHAVTEERVQAMKLTYEKALQEAETALKEQANATAEYIARLEAQVRSERLRHPIDKPAPPVHPVGTHSQMHSSRVDESVLQLQRLVDESVDEIERSKRRAFELEKNHAAELKGVWNQFQRYRLAQELLVTSLEKQISIEPEVNATKVFANINEASTALSNLSRKYNQKLMSLKYVLKALSAVSASTQREEEEVKESTRGVRKNRSQSPVESRQSMPMPLREELLEARLEVSEKEVLI
jgi:hypothetical protein